MTNMRAFIDKLNDIDALDENKAVKNPLHFPPEQMVTAPDDYNKKYPSKHINYYKMFYDYISSWLDQFDFVRKNKQTLSIEKFKTNLKGLEEIFSIFKRPKNYIIPYELSSEITTIIENLKITFDEYKTMNDPALWDRKYHDKIVNYLEQIQNLLNESMKDKRSKQSIGYFKEDRFIRPYNFITNWMLTFSQLNQKNSFPLITTLKENYDELVILIRKIPRYSAWLRVSGKKLFEYEHESFTKILGYTDELAENINGYASEIRNPNNSQVIIWKEKYSDKILNLLQNLQNELDFLRHKNRGIQRLARYTDMLTRRGPSQRR